MVKLKITEEGQNYLKKGLPEVNLINLLKKGSLSFEEAGKKIENFQIALQWAKKNGWVEIKEGRLVLAKQPDTKLQSALENIERAPEDLIKILIFRKLVKEEREDELTKAQQFVGKEIDKLTPELVKTGLWKQTKIKPYNVEFVGRKVYPGKRQPYNQFLEKTRSKLVELGFKEMKGNYIESEFWNFDALYQPQGHPSRDWTDVYTLKYPKQGNLPDPKLVERVKEAHENGWKTGSTGWGYKWNPAKAAHLMPRAHTTACSARTLSKKPNIPGKYFIIGRNFRPDVIDATHGIEFNHCEGIVVGDLTFRNLLGLLEMFAKEVAGATQVKFLPDYYPFVEPGVQMSAKHPDLGWVELGGAGMFREELTKPLGVDVPVIAWGLGIDRLAMFKLGINDIRQLFSTDLKWLREAEMVV
ncbi:MAG TPA: phenylalanine--tRNA ligase subunit alpha [archaeon]|nr:phenylalanine--tRNA ligase subunit alpha [archaeon]